MSTYSYYLYAFGLEGECRSWMSTSPEDQARCNSFLRWTSNTAGFSCHVTKGSRSPKAQKNGKAKGRIRHGRMCSSWICNHVQGLGHGKNERNEPSENLLVVCPWPAGLTCWSRGNRQVPPSAAGRLINCSRNHCNQLPARCIIALGATKRCNLRSNLSGLTTRKIKTFHILSLRNTWSDFECPRWFRSLMGHATDTVWPFDVSWPKFFVWP